MNSQNQTNNHQREKKFAFILLFIVTMISFTTGAALIYLHIDYQQDIVSETKTRLQSLTRRASADIAAILEQTMADADTMAQALSTGRVGASETLERMKVVLEKNGNYYGGTVTYRPYGFDPERRLYAPYYKKSGKNGTLEFVQLETVYDYTSPEFDWYGVPMKKGSCWGEPYWGPAGKTYMVTYSAVFYQSEGKAGDQRPLGVVTIDISMDQIRRIIEDIDLGPSGFGALVSRKGAYLYHPNTQYVVLQKNILEVARDKKDLDRVVMAEMVAEGRGGILDHISTTTEQAAWLVFEPVAPTGWSLQNTFLKKDIQIDVDAMRRQLIGITLSVLIFLLMALILSYLQSGEKSNRLAWTLIALSSLCITLAIGAIWTIALTYNPASEIAGVSISDKGTLEKIMNNYRYRSEEMHVAPPIYVPTGVYIDSIRFSGPSDVQLSGFIWQKYDIGLGEKISKALTFSKATKLSIKEVDRTVQNGKEIIRSYFEVEIRQKLTHVTYPLEQERLEIRIVHKEMDHNIVLIPDLDAYTIRSASLLPGLDGDAFISGWTLMNAYYELRRRDLNTNFGIAQSIERENYPVLYYNISIQRNFVDAFISNLTPLIIVAIMLFFLLLLSGRIDPSRVLSICVAMFFVIVFSHIDIRGKTSAQEIFYLEYFFFITYGSILYVALNAIGNIFKADMWLMRYDSKIPKLLYWPELLGLVLGVSALTFY